MREALNLFSKYLSDGQNSKKMSSIYSIELLLTASKVLFPLAMLEALANQNKNSLSPFNLIFAASGILLNIALPRFRDKLVNEVRHNVQRSVTRDMVTAIYDREHDAVVGTPTGMGAVLVSKNYGNVGLVIPTFFSDVLPVLAETLGIAALLTLRYGVIGLTPTLLLGTYIYRAITREATTAPDKEKSSLQQRVAFGQLLGSINNYQIAHQFNNTAYEIGKLDGHLHTLENTFNDVQAKGEKNNFDLSLISTGGIALMVGLFYLTRSAADSSSNALTTFVWYMIQFGYAINSLAPKISTLNSGLIDTKLITNFFTIQSKIPDPTVPVTFAPSQAPKVEFKNVNFDYGNGKGLTDLNFVVEPGKKVVLMGATGSGKSTILKLLQRFYNYEGAITINGIDITKVQKKDLRAAISVVSQDTGLIEDTVAANIKYGDLTASDNDVSKAAKFAGLNFSADRLATPVKQLGSNFSGGEKQRVNIARALMKKDASILLLDEPTSALDQKTSQEVIKTLDQMAGNSTVLIVSHDPNVAVNADHILYIDNGKIIERGTYTQLMEARGAFYNQVNVQCQKLGISPADIKPIPAQVEQKVAEEFTQWRSARRMGMSH